MFYIKQCLLFSPYLNFLGLIMFSTAIVWNFMNQTIKKGALN